MPIRVRIVREIASTKAVQFTGKNSREVADWVRKTGGSAKAGGSYVDVLDESGDLIVRALKGDWILLNSNGVYFVRDDVDFQTKYEHVTDKKA